MQAEVTVLSAAGEFIIIHLQLGLRQIRVQTLILTITAEAIHTMEAVFREGAKRLLHILHPQASTGPIPTEVLKATLHPQGAVWKDQAVIHQGHIVVHQADLPIAEEVNQEDLTLQVHQAHQALQEVVLLQVAEAEEVHPPEGDSIKQ